MLYDRLEFNFALGNFVVRIMNDELDAVYLGRWELEVGWFCALQRNWLCDGRC